MLSASDIKEVEECLDFNFTTSQINYLRNDGGYSDINECILPLDSIEILRASGHDMKGRACGKTTAHIVKLFFKQAKSGTMTTKEIKEYADYCEGYSSNYPSFYAHFARDIYDKLSGKGLNIVNWRF